jgi:hypothetical protein
MTKKTKLAEAVRLRLRELRYKQEDFTLDEQLEHDTFRTQLTRNIFSPHSLQAAANLLTDGDLSALKASYEFGVTSRGKETILQPTQALKEKVNRTIKTSPSALIEDIQRLYERLRPEDLAVICSLSEAPLEVTKFGWNSLKDSLHAAVKSGTTFVYIRPTDDYINKMSGSLSEFFSRRSPADEHNELKSNLVAGGLTKSHVDKHVLLIQPEWSPFWVVGMRFGFYSLKSEEGGRRDMTLFARFPFGGSLQGERSDDPNLLVFGDQRMRDAFHAYLVDCFQSSEKLRPLLGRLR